MITKQQKARLTVFTVVSGLLLVLMLGVLIYPSFRDKGLTYRIVFKGTSVNGLDPGAPVKYRGVAVGSVGRVRVHPRDLDSIVVFIKISRGFRVKTDMAAAQAYAGITGQKYIDISGGSQAAAPLKPDGEIPTARGLGEQAEDIVVTIESAVHNLNQVLGEENQKRIAQFLANTEQSAAIVSRVLKSKEEDLSLAVDNIGRAAEEFSGATENLRKISGDLARLTAKLDQSAGLALDSIAKRFSDQEMGRVIANLDAFVGGASTSLRRVEDVLLAQQQDLRRMVESMSAAIDNLSLFSRSLVEDPAALLRGGRRVKR
jgi:phospholipid/cholesterol/gamma-HCH transport system substrate-binding protein